VDVGLAALRTAPSNARSWHGCGDALSWKTSESEPSCSPGTKGTKYQDYDPFGRPGLTIAADNKPTYFAYHGVRAVVRTKRVWNGKREVPVNTTDIKAIGGKSFAYDIESRIVAASVPSDVAQPYQGYAYDGFGNLATIYRGTGPGNATYVTYTADSATNRLTGAMYDNSGELTNYHGSAYAWDVLGQVTSIDTGTEMWTHTYDAKGERAMTMREDALTAAPFAHRTAGRRRRTFGSGMPQAQLDCHPVTMSAHWNCGISPRSGLQW
jgi:hypothetical protein